MEKIVNVESHGNPLALNVNGIKNSVNPKNINEAIRIAKKYISKGYSVDIGLTQINSKNLSKLGYSVEAIFDPCTNIKAGSKILTNFYIKARQTRDFPDDQSRLLAALSAYNTGDFNRGFSNGYVAKYVDFHSSINPTSNPKKSIFRPALDAFTADTAAYIRPAN